MSKESYTVIYRTGGYASFEWKRIGTDFQTKADAKVKADEIERMGYKSLIFSTRQLNAAGMPEGFDA